MIISGPAPAPLLRAESYYRYQLMLRTRAMGAGVDLTVDTAGDVVTILARAPLGSAPVAEPAVEDARAERHGRVVIVEDNAPLAELMEAALGDVFSEVIRAPDGLAGLAALEKLDGSADLVVVDLMMPRMTGIELIRRLRARWPDLRCIAVSGAVPPELAEEAAQVGAAALLKKPFRLRDLQEAARRARAG